jgi:diguanylate cyclase (GGDEF)-like protein
MEDDDLPPEALVSMLMRLFEFAPIAMAITTSDTQTSSYAKVNDAYLRLTGLRWDDIRGKKLTSQGSAIDSPARDRRHRLLAEDGSYVLEEVDIVHANGAIIPTLISAQRTTVDGVSYDVEVIIDVSARVRQQRELENALRASARTDALCGLPNRACFDEVVAERVGCAKSPDKKLALAFIDLNGFKAVNDTLGHAAGDEVLRTIASRLRANFKIADFIARIGGDEFIVLMEVEMARLLEMQEELDAAMQLVFKPLAIEGKLSYTGAAVGVSLLKPTDTAASFVKRADENMYLAKTTGERIAIVYPEQDIRDPSAA